MKIVLYLAKTQMEIAESLGISQAQVSRLEKGAIAMVKKISKIEYNEVGDNMKQEKISWCSHLPKTK